MPNRPTVIRNALFIALACLLEPSRAATFTDTFGTRLNYLTNGVVGTIWDGVYFGAGEFANTGLGADTANNGPGRTLTCDANITGASLLTVQSLMTDWGDGPHDDGFFLFKEVTGDFSARVHVTTPFNNSPYNTAGLLVRAFDAGGNAAGGSENYLSMDRFNEYGYGFEIRNNVNGATTVPAASDGGSGSTNYYCRIDRVGNTLSLYVATTGVNDWVKLTNVFTRSDFNSRTLQVGINHATFGSGTNTPLQVQFDHFTLIASNLTTVASPSSATGLTLGNVTNDNATLSWTPGSGSAGSVVVMWTSNSTFAKEAPAAGISYNANPGYGLGDTLPAATYYVVYSGSGSSVVVSNLNEGSRYYAAVYSYAGSGASISYSHTPATSSFVAVGGPSNPFLAAAQVEGTNVAITFNAKSGKWYRIEATSSLNPANWQDIYPVAQLATGPAMVGVESGGALAQQRFYRVQQFDSPPSGVDLGPDATTTTSYVSPWQTLVSLNNGYTPANSMDNSQGAYGNWPDTGTQWVEYDWSLPITTSKIDVYWWTDGGGIQPPSACRLKYWNGTSMVLVSDPVGLGVALNQFNTTTFAPVTTPRLRLEFDSGTASTGILEWRVYDAGISPTNFPGAPTNSFFVVKANNGALASLKRAQDAFNTEYVSGRLGDVTIRYLPGGTAWQTAQTTTLASTGSGIFGWSSNGLDYTADYVFTNGSSPALALGEDYNFADNNSVLWTLSVTNLTGAPLTVGDLALPFPMNDTFSGVSSCAMKHSFISGYGSFIFWMRPNSVGPYLLLTTGDNTKLEYWDKLSGTSGDGFEAFIHSYVAGTNGAAQYPSVTTQGSRWRQPNTSLTLAAGASQTYSFKLQWVNSYDGIRQALVNEGKVDVHVVPGMTVPTNLFAQFALRTTQTVSSVTAEFPAATQIQFLGTTNVGAAGTYQLYQVQFSQLGENELTIQYGTGQTMYLEFFVTEPIETLIQKRASFLVSKQINDVTKWYNGLFCDLNMNDGVLVTPDNHDTLGTSFQVYEIASDDAGESRPAFMAAKEAVFPVQSEVTALDNYIQYFVWGGLQRTTNESSSYAIYGVPDWHTLRTNNNLSIGRGYDYPHIFEMYYGMYQVAKFHPEVTTLLPAQQYLQRAWGTAMALWSFGGGQATHVGLMNELVIPDIIDALNVEGMTNQAASLRTNWETKVNYYVTGQADLFASEYAFDSTGFESQEAYAKYAAQHVGSSLLMGSTNVSLFQQQIQQYATTQITANVFDRGWLETAYYYYGSDYRGDMGDDYIVTYMAQEGGWGLLDYALYYATNSIDYLRLGYASYLNGWSTINSGTPASNYGFWYPGAANDGGCGGGFEPSPYNTTWLGGQPMHRGAWYYSAEENLGYCGAIRSAATILADDPIFGRFCYGGSWQQVSTNLQVIPMDGVRRRFHAMLNNGAVHAIIDTDRFALSQPVILASDVSALSFTLETGNTSSHTARLHLSALAPGAYTLSDTNGPIATLTLVNGQETIYDLPMPATTPTKTFFISH